MAFNNLKKLLGGDDQDINFPDDASYPPVPNQLINPKSIGQPQPLNLSPSQKSLASLLDSSGIGDTQPTDNDSIRESSLPENLAMLAGPSIAKGLTSVGKDLINPVTIDRLVGNEVGSIKSPLLTPDEDIRNLAKQYMQSKNLKELQDQPYAQVDPNVGSKIAEAFQNMQHDPNNPEVKSAYNALINETTDQYKLLKQLGLNIEKIPSGMENPYPNGSKQVINDINQNKHLWYYPTDSGFGTNTNISDHPLLAKTNETINGEPLAANDLFRIVHDIFGHAKEGVGFGPRGEENAFREHAQMYSPEALKALATETRGQNSWVNYGPNGEANRANPLNTIYADQKAGLLPDWATKTEQPLGMLNYPVSINGAESPLHATIKSFNPNEVSPDMAHEAASKLNFSKLDPSNIGIEPSILQDRNGNDLHVLNLKANGIKDLHDQLGSLGKDSFNGDFQPHITVDKDLWQAIKDSGAKNAEDAGLSFGSPTMKVGDNTLQTYPTSNDEDQKFQILKSLLSGAK